MSPSEPTPTLPSGAASSGPGWHWVDGRRPGALDLLRSFVTLPRRLWELRELVWAGVRRDLAARVHGTVFGRAWPLIAPLFQFVLYWVLFTRLLGFRMPELPDGQQHAMGVWLFTGALLWGSFADALSRAAQSVEANGNLLTKVAFASEILPLQAVATSAILLLPGLLVFLLLAALTPVWSAPTASALLILLLWALQVALTLGLGWLLAAAQVFLKDTVHLLGMALTLAMLFTPVFWVPSVRVIPLLEPWLPAIDANPLHHWLQLWRVALLGGEPAFLFQGSPGRSLAIVAATALAACFVGHVAFQLGKRRFADEV